MLRNHRLQDIKELFGPGTWIIIILMVVLIALYILGHNYKIPTGGLVCQTRNTVVERIEYQGASTTTFNLSKC